MSESTGGVVRFDKSKSRWEYWYQSRCIAFSVDLDVMTQAYPLAMFPAKIVCGRCDEPLIREYNRDTDEWEWIDSEDRDYCEDYDDDGAMLHVPVDADD